MAEEQAIEKKKPETTEIVVKNSDGETFSTRLKGPDGKFVKKPKTMPSSRELTRRGRAMLFKRIKVEGCEDPVMAFEAMTQFMIDVSMGKVEGDPKKLMVAVQAYEKVLKRLIGKEPLSDEDREAQKEQNAIRFVLVQPPELKNKEEKKQLTQPIRPAFIIDAEIVKQN